MTHPVPGDAPAPTTTTPGRRCLLVLLVAGVAVLGAGCTTTMAGAGGVPVEELATLGVPERWLSGPGYRVAAIDGQKIVGSVLVRYRLLPSDHVVTVIRSGELPGAPERVDLALRTSAGGTYQLRTGVVAGEPTAPPVAIYDLQTGQVVSHAVATPTPGGVDR